MRGDHPKDALNSVPTRGLYEDKVTLGHTKQQSFERILETAENAFAIQEEYKNVVKMAREIVEPYREYIKKNPQDYYDLAKLYSLIHEEMEPFLYGSEKRGKNSEYFPVRQWEVQIGSYRKQMREIRSQMDSAKEFIEELNKNKQKKKG